MENAERREEMRRRYRLRNHNAHRGWKQALSDTGEPPGPEAKSDMTGGEAAEAKTAHRV